MRIKKCDHAKDLPLPTFATAGSAGLDLCSAVEVLLSPGKRRLVPCGIAVEIPDGYEGQVRPRSGLAIKHGVTVLNAPGTVDSDFRGEMGVVLVNHGEHDFIISRGERIAQLVISPVLTRTNIIIREVNELSTTARGAGGWGSTGK